MEFRLLFGGDGGCDGDHLVDGLALLLVLLGELLGEDDLGLGGVAGIYSGQKLVVEESEEAQGWLVCFRGEGFFEVGIRDIGKPE